MIAITKSIDQPSPDYHVIVHRDWWRSPVTGLTAPCVAKCNWVRDVKQDRVIRTLGRMPNDLLETIVEAFDALQADSEYDGWI